MILNEGENTLYLKVTAEDGKTSKIYTMKIIRETAPKAHYGTHVKLVLVGNKAYADFTSKTAARKVCKDMIAKGYIMNYYFYEK